MHKTFKKAIAILMAATMALTPLAVSAYEAYETDNEASQFEATKQAAAHQAAVFAETFSIAGITIAVVDIDSSFSWFYSFGYADAPNQVPVTPYTLFSIGSTAKTFTAVAVMQLAEAGVLCLDEPIVTYLPGFSLLPNPVYGGDYRNITARMLLTHVSGMHEIQGEGFFTIDGQDRDVMNRLLPMLAELHMQNAELNRTTYNNTAYTILGILVAALTGSTNYFDGFVSYTQENIFDTLGMVSSSFEIGGHNRAYIALPHLDAATVLEDFVYVSVTPAGGMVSNARDMALFMQAMLNGGVLAGDDSGRILSEETVQAMAQLQDFGIQFPTNQPSGLQMGLGMWHLSRPSGTITVGHGGNLQHHTDMILDFDNGIGVFVSVNSATGATAALPLAEAIWVTAVYEKTGQAVPREAYFGTPFVAEDLQKLVGWYTIAGPVVLSEDSVLALAAFPGVPVPIELTPAEDGTFDSLLGNVRFVEVEGIMFLFLGTDMIGERIEVSPTTPAFDRWMGQYGVYHEGEWIAAMTLGVDANGFPFASFGGMVYLVEMVDGYTVHFPGRGRGLGSVGLLSMDDGVAIFSYSDLVLTKIEAAPAEEEPVEEEPAEEEPIEEEPIEESVIGLRFAIGSTEYLVNRTPRQMATAPFIDATYNRTMIPMHVFADVFGAEVTWLPELQAVKIVYGDVNIVLSAYEPLLSGMGIVHEVDGIVFVPLAYVAFVLGGEAHWDGANQAVYVLW